MVRQQHSAVLPMAYVALRVVIIVNWIIGGLILALLVYTFADASLTMRALKITRFPNPETVLNAVRGIAALGVIGILLHYAVLKRLLAIVATVRGGDPFVAANAVRLQAIAWVLLALQVLGFVIGVIARLVSTPGHRFHLNAGFSTSGWLAVILTFILARVFADGAAMREELEGTV